MRPEQLGPYTLHQPDGVFPLGGDSLALGDFATLRRGFSVCDLGCGSGALMLLLARREPQLTLTGVELDPLSAHAAQDNLARNGLAGRVLQADLQYAPLPEGQFDLVISNPPYFPTGSGRSGGMARSEESCTLDRLCAAAARLLKNGGRFALCHRPQRLTDVLCALRAHRLEPKRLKLLAHSPAHPPSVLLVEAVLGGGPGLDVLPME